MYGTDKEYNTWRNWDKVSKISPEDLPIQLNDISVVLRVEHSDIIAECNYFGNCIHVVAKWNPIPATIKSLIPQVERIIERSFYTRFMDMVWKGEININE